MLVADYTFIDVFWSMFVFFIWIMWFWLLFTIWSDIFRRDDISGWVKALWLVFTILLPFLGVFVYLITQNDEMTKRASGKRAGNATAIRRVRAADGRKWGQRGGGDRAREGTARPRCDHAGGVRRPQDQRARS